MIVLTEEIPRVTFQQSITFAKATPLETMIAPEHLGALPAFQQCQLGPLSQLV